MRSWLHCLIILLLSSFAELLTSRHSGKQTKTGNAKCCTLKTIWAECLFALKPREQPTNRWWMMKDGLQELELAGSLGRAKGFWLMSSLSLGCCRGWPPFFPISCKGSKDVRGGGNVLVGILQRQISFSWKICALFSVKTYGNWVHCGLQSCGCFSG